MQKLIFLALFSLAFPVHTRAEEVDFALGNYAGRTGAGAPCEVSILSWFGSNVMSRYVFSNRSAMYSVDFGSDKATSQPGKFAGYHNVMRDGSVRGRTYYRTIVGAPIFGRMYRVDFEFRYTGKFPTSIRQTRRPLGKDSPRVVEDCQNLRKL